MSDCHSTPFDVPCKSAKTSKPDPTYPDFPLYAHTACVWAKKIGGRGHYFGKWDDPHAALKKYLEHKDDLHAGRTPRPDPQALKVKDIANAFLNAKREAQEAGELSSRTWLDYRFIMDMLVEGLGKHRSVTDLAPPEGQGKRISLDGKTARGSRDGAMPGQHLVAAYSAEAQAVLAQIRVDAKTNEHKAALQLLGILPVKGTIFTGDALFCQRDLCAEIITAGGDYVFTAEDNQPSLGIDISAGLAS